MSRHLVSFSASERGGGNVQHPGRGGAPGCACRAVVRGDDRSLRPVRRLHRRQARPVSRACRARPGVGRRVGERRRDSRALRARVARAAGGRARSSTSARPRMAYSGSCYPSGHAEALLDEESLNYASPFGRLLVACLRPIDALLDAYRNGGGVPYADYGADLHEGQAAFTRPLFSRLLAQEWLPSVPEIHARLLGRSARPGGRRRLRRWDLEHRDRARISQGSRRWHRPRHGVDRIGPPSPCRQRRRGQGQLRGQGCSRSSPRAIGTTS